MDGEPIELLDVITPAETASPIAPPDENGIVSFDDDAETQPETTKPAEPEAPPAPEGEAPTEGEKPEDGAEPTEEKEPKDGEDHETDADKPAKKLSGAQRAARRVAALEAEVAALKASRPSVASGEKPSADAIEKLIGPEPKEADYSDFLEFDRARTAYEVEKRQAGRELGRQAAADQERAQAHAAELREAHGDRIEALEKALPGSAAKIKAANDLKVDPHVVGLLLDSDKSAELALHFADNPDVLAKLNGMPPLAAAREMGRLEAKISAPKPRTETKAPAPVAAPKGGATKPSADAELTAWMKATYG